MSDKTLLGLVSARVTTLLAMGLLGFTALFSIPILVCLDGFIVKKPSAQERELKTQIRTTVKSSSSEGEETKQMEKNCSMQTSFRYFNCRGR